MSSSPLAQTERIRLMMQETRVRSLGWEDPLGEGMATHSSVLAWEFPWTEPGGGGCSPWGQESDTTEQLTLHSHCYTSGLIHVLLSSPVNTVSHWRGFQGPSRPSDETKAMGPQIHLSM